MEVVVDHEKEKDNLTISRTATRVVLVQVVLQCVPAPSDTHHHMSAKDLCGKKERKEEENKALVGGRQNGKTHSCMNETSGPQTHARIHTDTHSTSP